VGAAYENMNDVLTRQDGASLPRPAYRQYCQDLATRTQRILQYTYTSDKLDIALMMPVHSDHAFELPNELYNPDAPVDAISFGIWFGPNDINLFLFSKSTFAPGSDTKRIHKSHRDVLS
jgi:hypothetical protein